MLMKKRPFAPPLRCRHYAMEHAVESVCVSNVKNIINVAQTCLNGSNKHMMRQ